jgi:hypothetical protein
MMPLCPERCPDSPIINLSYDIIDTIMSNNIGGKSNIGRTQDHTADLKALAEKDRIDI